MSKKIIFFDTETTGNTNKDFLCQLAYKIYNVPEVKPFLQKDSFAQGLTSETIFSGLYKPPIRIPPEASAVHHISNRMLENQVSFQESPDFEKIKKLFEDEENIVVAHNAPFDLMMLKKEQIEPKNFICTLRLARDLDSEEKIEKYNLQYLRYLLDLDVDAIAHSALGDVMVLEKLFERLKNKIDGSEEAVLQKMIEVSSHPSIFKYLRFGKYNGRKIEEIARIDRGYLEWLLAEKSKSDQIEEDWIYTLKHYLNLN
jgi:DNA polymerase III epsilon subunit-like protein